MGFFCGNRNKCCSNSCGNNCNNRCNNCCFEMTCTKAPQRCFETCNSYPEPYYEDCGERFICCACPQQCDC